MARNLDKRRTSELFQQCSSVSGGPTQSQLLPLPILDLSMKRMDVARAQKRRQQGHPPNLQWGERIKQEARIRRRGKVRLRRNPTMNTQRQESGVRFTTTYVG